MSRTIAVVYDGQVFRPEVPVDLEPNTRLEITLPAADQQVAPVDNAAYAAVREIYTFEDEDEVSKYLSENEELVEFLLEAAPAIRQYFPEVRLALKVAPVYTGSEERRLVIVMYVEGDKDELTALFNQLKGKWWFRVKDSIHYKLSIEIEHPEFSTSRAEAAFEKLIGSVEAPEDWSLEHDHYLYGSPKRYTSTNNE